MDAIRRTFELGSRGFLMVLKHYYLFIVVTFTEFLLDFENNIDYTYLKVPYRMENVYK
ncbi:MAG TPA: hypothetical protein VN704_02800 [Verrucomicrobiae bacterium]|nr:hypothetical protein [Verrucomicrobiae bacterium]